MSIFKPKALYIEGFLCFAARQVFLFPETPGVFRVDGVNEVDPRQGANGSGKTGLLDAICWCLYGKTTKGIFGPSVKSWHRKKANQLLTEVCFEGFRNDEPFVISRKQDPNSITLEFRADKRVVTQDEIDEFLERNYDRFLSTSMFVSRRRKSFMDLGPTEQAERLSSILQLDIWADRSARAKLAAAAHDTEFKNTKANLERIEDRIILNRQLVDEQKQARADFQLKQQEQRSADQDLIAQLKGELPQLGEKPEWVEVYDCRNVFNKIKETNSKLATKLSNVVSDLQRLRQDGEKIEAKIEELEDQETPTCPTCQQNIEDSRAREIRDTWQHQLDVCHASYQALKEKKKELESRKIELDASENNLSLQALEEERSQAEHRRLFENDLQLYAQQKTQRTIAVQRLNELRNKEYPKFDDRSLRRAEEDLERDMKSVDGLRRKMAECQESARLHGFWAEGFSKIRISEMERACLEFQTYFYNAFEILGLVGWEVKISFSKQLASKKTVQEFNIQIKSPQSPDFTPWESWSDGQQHRLMIAGLAAYADLVASRTGVRDLLECWDEQTNSLGPEGCEDQMEYFAARSQARQATLMVIDHRTKTSPVFSRTAFVRNTAKGAKIAWV